MSRRTALQGAPLRAGAGTLLATAALLAGACGDPSEGDGPRATEEEMSAGSEIQSMAGRSFDRSVALVGMLDDSLLAVPWLIAADVTVGGVERTVRALVLRGSEWEPVFQAAWEDPPTRAPWRVLPREGMRLVVGSDNALERIVYEDGVRQLEVALGQALSEWAGPRGGTYRLLEGAAVVGERTVDGYILDVGRSAAPDEPPHGGWAFLVSGDSLQVVLHSPRRTRPVGGDARDSVGGDARDSVGRDAADSADAEPRDSSEVDPGEGGRGGPGAQEPTEPAAEPAGPTAGAVVGSWQGWARLDFRELRWPALTMAWTETRAFERARRDVPVAWSVSSPGDEVTGELSARGADVQAGEGEGPQLPVSGLFGVRGTLVIEGREYPVVGLLRHVQG